MNQLLSITLIVSMFGGYFNRIIKTQEAQTQPIIMLSEIISTDPQAPVMVIFGGNPNRRDEVIRNLKTIGDFTVFGTLSEEEGLEKLKSLPKVDLVMIGGRYELTQRQRIRAFVKLNLPNTKMTEPGYDYPYENEAIKADVKSKLGF